jgi:hypothetical protein
MGLEIVVPRTRPCPLLPLLEALAAGGLACSVAMVDRVLLGPGASVPTDWRDARLRTPAGMLALRRSANGVAVVVFGNADATLQAAQRTVADVVRTLP